MAKLSLLEQARQIKRSNKVAEEITPEEIELAIAWMKDEITLTAVSKVLNQNSSGTTAARLALILRAAYQAGVLRIK